MDKTNGYTREVRSGSEIICVICGLNSNHFQLRIDVLFQHALNRHQRAGEGTRTTAARALIANAQRVISKSDNLEIAAIAHQRRPDFLIQNFVDLQQPRIVARHRRY